MADEFKPGDHVWRKPGVNPKMIVLFYKPDMLKYRCSWMEGNKKYEEYFSAVELQSVTPK